MEGHELNEHLEKLYTSAEAASSEGLVDRAIKQCEAAIELLDLNFDEDCKFTHSDFLMLAGHACWEDGDIEAAQRFYRQAYDMEPNRLDTAVAMGVAMFHLGRFVAAQYHLEMVSVEDPEIGEVWYYLALLALRRNDANLADIFFCRANDLEPERWLKPKFLSLPETEKFLQDVLEAMPPELQAVLEHVTIVLDERPMDDLIHSVEPPLDPLMLGLFQGIPLPERSTFDVVESINQIYIFTQNIALIASNEDKLREELAITLKHELGHFLGLDEDDLAARGLD